MRPYNLKPSLKIKFVEIGSTRSDSSETKALFSVRAKCKREAR